MKAHAALPQVYGSTPPSGSGFNNHITSFLCVLSAHSVFLKSLRNKLQLQCHKQATECE